MSEVKILTSEPTVAVIAEMSIMDRGLGEMVEWVRSHRPECLPDDMPASLAPMDIRIGRNVLFFDENGKFDGTESNFCAGADHESIQQAFELQGQCKGLAPETPYFPPGSPAFVAETRAWPSAKKEHSGQNYAIVPKGPKLDS